MHDFRTGGGGALAACVSVGLCTVKQLMHCMSLGEDLILSPTVCCVKKTAAKSNKIRTNDQLRWKSSQIQD